MKIDAAAACLESLGNPTRLEIFRLLVRAGPPGLSVGRIQDRLAIPGSTLSHHLSQLARHGLIRQERDGRTIHCRPDFARMNGLLEFLTRECCRDSGC